MKITNIESKRQSKRGIGGRMTDLIDRQAAIDALDDYILDEVTDLHGDSVREIFERLPSEQPEHLTTTTVVATDSQNATANDVIIGKTYHTGNLTSQHLSLISDEILERINKLERDTRFDYTEISCRNCGGKILQKIDDHILKCPYCGTAYIIGKYQINS